MRRLTRRQWLVGAGAGACAALTGSRARAFGEADLLTPALLRYDSPTWNPRPSAWRRLLIEIEGTTSILVAQDAVEVRASSEALFRHPLVVLAGDRAFEPWSEGERLALRAWLNAGGTLFVDSSEGRAEGAFDRSVRRELEAILPQAPLSRIDSDHVLWRTFYLVDSAAGRLVIQPWMEGQEVDGRMAVVYSQNDHMGAWARDAMGRWEYAVTPGGENQRTMAQRFGVNLAMYVLCTDYKSDQVHVPFLLQRRRWRVNP